MAGTSTSTHRRSTAKAGRDRSKGASKVVLKSGNLKIENPLVIRKWGSEPNSEKTGVRRQKAEVGFARFFRKVTAESRATGQHLQFKVDISPDGEAVVSPIVPGGIADGGPLKGTLATRSQELEAALSAARERGQLRAAEILSGVDMLSADALAERLGVTRMTVNSKRQSGQLLALDGPKRGYRFPVWQLDADGKPYAELPKLLNALGTAWAVYRFLVQPQGALDGMTGREALERGQGRAVLEAADGIARGDFR